MITKHLIEYAKSLDSRVEIVLINPNELVFEENVKMNCYYCGKYNSNWRCPPKLPDIDYKKMMSEFENGMFILMKFDISDSLQYDNVRGESGVTLHKLILSLEKWMWNNNNSNCLSFIGGSCKLCKNGCGKDRCNNPYMSRSPIEATGVNVIKSARKYGIDIVFPPNEYMIRAGIMLWQD